MMRYPRHQRRKRWFFLAFFCSILASLRLMSKLDISVVDKDVSFEESSGVSTSVVVSSIARRKTLLYITTHFSDSHLRYFRCCWPKLVKESPLIQSAHVIVASTNTTIIPAEELSSLEKLFNSNPSYQFLTPPNASHLSHCEPFKKPQNPRKSVSVSYKQCLANYMIAFGWPTVSSYDWMIRINPDVLIRRSQWFLQSMDNSSIGALLIHCGEGTKQIHTDFWAVRPAAISNAKPFWEMGRIGMHLNHERTAFQHFQPIIASRRQAWVPGVEPSDGVCRARGMNALVSHEHDSCFDGVCHSLEGWDLAA